MKRTTGGGHLENAFSRWPLPVVRFKMAAASSAFHVWNDERLLALPDEWKHETICSNMAVLF